MLVVSDIICVISIFLPQSQFMNTSQEDSSSEDLSAVYLLIGGVTFARFGIYLFDLCILQMFQEFVEESKRGVFSGVETLLCNSMDMIKFALVILLPSPQLHFGYLVLVIFTSVFLGWCIFVVFVRKSFKLQKVRSRNEEHAIDDEELVIFNATQGNRDHFQVDT